MEKIDQLTQQLESELLRLNAAIDKVGKTQKILEENKNDYEMLIQASEELNVLIIEQLQKVSLEVLRLQGVTHTHQDQVAEMSKILIDHFNREQKQYKEFRFIQYIMYALAAGIIITGFFLLW